MKKTVVLKTFNAKCREFFATCKLVLPMLVCLLLLLCKGYAQNITRPNIEGPYGLQVNSYTGSLFYQRTDLFVAGRGLSTDITFTYNSADRASDWGFGAGWTFYYNRFYTANDTSITFYNSDGRKDQYKIIGNSYIAPVGIFDVVTNYATGKFKLVTKDGIQYFFDDATHKKLTGIVDKNNNLVTLNYTGNDLTSLTDAAGRVVTFSWSGNKLTEINANFSGVTKKIQYVYDLAGTLISVTDPLGKSTSYTYIRGKLMGTLTDANGNVTNILYSSSSAVIKFVSCESEKNISYNSAELKTYAMDINNDKTFVTTYAYNNAGNLINKAGNCCGFNTSYSYDEDNNINQVKDANGHLSTYSYDKKGNLLSETDPLAQTMVYTYENTFNKVTSSTDKRGNKTEYSYDNKGNLLQIKEPLNAITKFNYEDNGDKKDFTDPLGNKTSFTYDTYGYLATAKNANGGATTLAYDVWGNLITQQDANNHTTAYTYDAGDRISTTTDALGSINKFTYDGNGNVISVIDANNNKAEFLYDSRNKPLSVTDAANNISTMRYDAVGNILASTDAKGNKTSYTYDKQSRKESETNANGDAIFYNYDGNGNKIGIAYPNGNNVAIRYDVLNRATDINDKLGIVATYQYDANNNKISEADALGNTTTYQYDALNRVLVKTDPPGNSYNYTYDANGNIVFEKDRNGNSTAYQYDALNHLTIVTDAAGFTTKYTYDAAGNMLSVTDAKGNATAYNYDAVNRNTQETFADNTTKIYTYDAAGNLLTRQDNKGQLTNYTYDKLYRPVVKTYPGGTDSLGYDATGHLIKAKNSAATVLFIYDKAYRIVSENLNGKSTSYAYNITANTKQITYPGGRVIKRKLDERNQLKAINEGDITVASFDYNNAGENTGKHYANGTGTSLQYNSNKQVTALAASPAAIIDFGYTYDKEGNPLTAAFNHRAANSEQYNYDPKNQLTQYKKGNSQQTTYNYDGVGNRVTTQVNGATTTYTANNMNAYTSITQGSTVTNSFDANGNMLFDGTRNFTYDIENRLTAVDAGATATYTYDALGRRIKKVASGNTINYYFDGLQVIEERNEMDTLQASYVWGTWLDDIVTMTRNGNAYYYHSNLIGSVIMVTNFIGLIMENYEYDSFGNPSIYNTNYQKISNSIIGNTYTFSGRQYDNESRLFYYRFRYYDWLTGDFIQKDPFGYHNGLKPFSYAQNNPIIRIDPLGLSWTGDLTKWTVDNINISEEVSDGIAGFGDVVSFGLTNYIREVNGVNNYVDKCSNAYRYGKIAGIINSAVLGFGRLGYAGIARLNSIKLLKNSATFANAEKAVVFRNDLKFWFNLGLTEKAKDVGFFMKKYNGDLTEIIKAAGRTATGPENALFGIKYSFNILGLYFSGVAAINGWMSLNRDR